jgi:hypothetical protein
MHLKAKLLGLVAASGFLAGCGLLPGVGGQQVLGSFVDSQDGTYKWANVNTSKVRLALVGIGQGGLPTYDNQQEIKNINQFKTYVMELPTSASEAAYRVYAYCDANSNSRLDSGEDIADSGSKYLLYANSEGSKTYLFVGTVNVKKGWNGYDLSKAQDSTNPYQGESYPGYDLTLRANCQ